MPGPPLGPSYLITTTSPDLTLPASIPSQASSWLSKIIAGPEWVSICFATPALFTTEPFGARLPWRMARPPVFEYALSRVWMHSVFLMSAPAMFWPMVFPVTVMQSVLRRESALLISFRIALMPPAASTSSICHELDGETLQMLGHFSEMVFIRWRSYLMFASFAMASVWRTVFVEPPIAMSRMNALSRDFSVTMSSVFKSSWTNDTIRLPAAL